VEVYGAEGRQGKKVTDLFSPISVQSGKSAVKETGFRESLKNFFLTNKFGPAAQNSTDLPAMSGKLGSYMCRYRRRAVDSRGRRS